MDDNKKILGDLGKGLGKAVGSEVKSIAKLTFEQLGVSGGETDGSKKNSDVLKKSVDEGERKKLLEGLYGKSSSSDSKIKEQHAGDIDSAPSDLSSPLESLGSQEGRAEEEKPLSQEEQLKKQKLEQLRSRLHQEVQELGRSERREETVQDRLEEEDQKEDQKKQMGAIEERKKAPIAPPRKGPERKLGIGG